MSLILPLLKAVWLADLSCKPWASGSSMSWGLDGTFGSRIWHQYGRMTHRLVGPLSLLLTAVSSAVIQNSLPRHQVNQGRGIVCIHQTSTIPKEYAHMQWQFQFWKLCWGKSSVEVSWSVHQELLSKTAALNKFWSAVSSKNVQLWGIWKVLQLYTSIYLYWAITSTQLSNLGLPLPVSIFLRNRGGLVNDSLLCRNIDIFWVVCKTMRWNNMS